MPPSPSRDAYPAPPPMERDRTLSRSQVVDKQVLRLMQLSPLLGTAMRAAKCSPGSWDTAPARAAWSHSCTDAMAWHLRQVITRTSGLQLGVISHFLVHPRTAAVMFLALRAKGLGGQETGGLVPLSALFQVEALGHAAEGPHKDIYLIQSYCLPGGYARPV